MSRENSLRAIALVLAVAVAPACRHAGWAAPASPAAERRAVLLDPAHEFWRQRAPDVFRARFETTRGAFVIEAHRAWGPLGVDRLYNLVRLGFFDDSRFYRVLPNYIVQFGIPGDPAIASAWKDRAFPDDSLHQNNVRGTFAFAMTGPGARTTQIYINRANNIRNDGQGFTMLGRVIEGMDVIDSLYGGYGDDAVGGMRAGRQGPAMAGGNAYLDREFPRMDRLIRATIIAAKGP